MSEKQEIIDLVKACEKATKKKLSNFPGVQTVVNGDIEAISSLAGKNIDLEPLSWEAKKLLDTINQIPSSIKVEKCRMQIQVLLDVEYEVRKVLKEIRKSIRKLSSDADQNEFKK